MLVEIVVRCVWPQVLEPHPRGMYAVDAEIGYALTPNFDGWFRRAEFNTRVTTGVRGAALRPKKDTSIRILCLGDSFTWGYGVEHEAAFAARLEQDMAARFPNRDVQVVNAGAPGYGTEEELALFKKIGPVVKPDLVIVGFFSGNDFIDNRMPARSRCEIRDGMLCRREDTRFLRDRPRWLRSLDWVKRKSHFATFCSERVGYLLMRAGVMASLDNASSEHFTEKDARQTQAFLRRLTHEVESQGDRSLLLFIPEKQQILSNPRRPLRAARLVGEVA